MSEKKFLTAEEVSERYRSEISVGTLRNWRAMRIGPAFVKVGKAVLYPVGELDRWDQKNTVTCCASKLELIGARERGDDARNDARSTQHDVQDRGYSK